MLIIKSLKNPQNKTKKLNVSHTRKKDSMRRLAFLIVLLF